MRYLYAVLSFLLFLAALGFALKNAHPVTLHYYLGISWHAPLVLVLLIAFGIGALAGVVACLTLVIRQRRKLLAIEKELRALEQRAD